MAKLIRQSCGESLSQLSACQSQGEMEAFEEHLSTRGRLTSQSRLGNFQHHYLADSYIVDVYSF